MISILNFNIITIIKSHEFAINKLLVRIITITADPNRKSRVQLQNKDKRLKKKRAPINILKTMD